MTFVYNFPIGIDKKDFNVSKSLPKLIGTRDTNKLWKTFPSYQIVVIISLSTNVYRDKFMVYFQRNNITIHNSAISKFNCSTLYFSQIMNMHVWLKLVSSYALKFHYEWVVNINLYFTHYIIDIVYCLNNMQVCMLWGYTDTESQMKIVDELFFNWQFEVIPSKFDNFIDFHSTDEWNLNSAAMKWVYYKILKMMWKGGKNDVSELCML